MPEGVTTIDEKCEIASEMIKQSPPGELKDVLADLQVLVNDDESLYEKILPSLQEYNEDQLTVIPSPGHDHQTIVSKFGRTNDHQYIDPKGKQKVEFDHIQLSASNPEPHELDVSLEVLRAALQDACDSYVTDHYRQGVATVFVQQDQYHICIVSNKYNPISFWNGRYRGIWSIDKQTNQLKGSVFVNVHYFEDGNVQLNTSHSFTTDMTIDSDHQKFAKHAIAQIKKLESEYQLSLNETYKELSETTFKSLRRHLPYTKTKVDWHKIGNYKIGAELSSK